MTNSKNSERKKKKVKLGIDIKFFDKEMTLNKLFGREGKEMEKLFDLMVNAMYQWGVAEIIIKEEKFFEE